MRFDPEALANKNRFLDHVFQMPQVVEKVVERHLSPPFHLIPLPRIWEPGGGATLFRIESSPGPYLLKVKHRCVWIESILESEQDYLRRPSLQNEYNFIRLLDASWVPQVLFYDEIEPFQFLALEWLETFHAATQKMSAAQLLNAWEKIVDTVRVLYVRGVVHTDIHEHNICFRDNLPVICDLEEARFLEQDVDFEESLDVIGENKYGTVGEFPSTEGAIHGLTCLRRLRRVFQSLLKERLPEYIADCNFDNSCPYNLDELQEPDSRVYQSLAFSDLKIEGQRPEQDTRLLLFTYLLLKLAQRKKSIRHLDIGSNLGVFCLQATKNPHVELSIGLEAFEQYVDVARALAFLYDFPRARFFTFVCGEEGIAAKFEDIDFVTMLAVYHHISEKDALLRDLRDLGAAYLLAEFATQDRYYPERGALSYELQHIQNVTGYQYCHFLASTCDYNRPLILFSNDDLSYLDRRLIRSMFTKSHLTKKTLWSLINLFIAIVQKNTPQWKTSGII